MFTGIIQAIGQLQRKEPRGGDCRVTVAAGKLAMGEVRLGDSIAVNGVCLTVVEFGGGGFSADVSRETLSRTTLGELGAGAALNLELALTPSTRLGGHIVSGHIDETGRVESIDDRGRDIQIRIACSPTFARQSVLKGSVAIDGISLTISGLGDDWFEVNIIPHTLSETTLRDRKPGDKVNLESDILGKYVARQLGKDTSGITLKTLEDAGFI